MDEEPEPQAQLKLRVGRELREYLEAAASARGVSLNREITDRLERSREDESLFEEEMGGKEMAGIIEIVGRTMSQIGSVIGSLDPVARERGWLRSPYAFDQAVRGACEVLEAFRPTGGEMPDLSGVPWMERAGQGIARSVLRAVTAGRSGWEERVRAKLGDLLTKVEHK
jgi:hypothetical protein